MSLEMISFVNDVCMILFSKEDCIKPVHSILEVHCDSPMRSDIIFIRMPFIVSFYHACLMKKQCDRHRSEEGVLSLLNFEKKRDFSGYTLKCVGPVRP